MQKDIHRYAKKNPRGTNNVMEYILAPLDDLFMVQSNMATKILIKWDEKPNSAMVVSALLVTIPGCWCPWFITKCFWIRN